MKARIDDYKGLGTPDDKKEQKFEISSQLESVLTKYRVALDVYDVRTGPGNWMKDMITEELTPEEINVFLQLSVQQEQRQPYPWVTGKFTTYLLRSSIKGGHKTFTLDITGIRPLHDLCSELYSYDGKHEITVIGNPGKNFGRWSGGANLTVHGNVGSRCGYRSEKSNITIHGDIDEDFGAAAKSSHFTIHGDISVPVYGGNYPAIPDRCTFTAFTRESYERLCKGIPRTTWGLRRWLGNKVRLEDTETGEELEKKYL